MNVSDLEGCGGYGKSRPDDSLLAACLPASAKDLPRIFAPEISIRASACGSDCSSEWGDRRILSVSRHGQSVD